MRAQFRWNTLAKNEALLGMRPVWTTPVLQLLQYWACAHFIVLEPLQNAAWLLGNASICMRQLKHFWRKISPLPSALLQFPPLYFCELELRKIKTNWQKIPLSPLFKLSLSPFIRRSFSRWKRDPLSPHHDAILKARNAWKVSESVWSQLQQKGFSYYFWHSSHFTRSFQAVAVLRFTEKRLPQIDT